MRNIIHSFTYIVKHNIYLNSGASVGITLSLIESVVESIVEFILD